MGTTSIQWTEKTWNPVRGCSLVSAGCTNCYAMKMAHRFSGKGQPYEGLTELSKRGPRWNGKAVFVPEMADAPLRAKKPTVWFVNSMSDLFHPDITNEQIAAVFGVMAACPQHTFQVLTKRPKRAAEWFKWVELDRGVDAEQWVQQCAFSLVERFPLHPVKGTFKRFPWPLLNVWIGVSAESQETADERIPVLVRLPADVRFVSAEPLLGPIDLRYAAFNGADSFSAMAGIDCVIAGGESGPGARPCNIEWIRSIVQQCSQADVACFVKQLGSKPVGLDSRLADRKGGDMGEWPTDLQVRQMPRTAAREAAE
jgi:protein gp37